MKVFKNIIISSNGSLCFCTSPETSLSGKLVNIQKQDDKNFNLNQKKSTNNIDWAHTSSYKKKYLR